MNYSRVKLRLLRNEENRTEYNSTVQDLVTRVLNGEKVNLAEEEFACSVIRTLISPETNDYAYNIRNLTNCKNFSFKTTYMLYFNDLNGNKAVKDVHGEIPHSRKVQDVTYLNLEYQNWLKSIEGKEGENNLLGYVSREIQQQIKDMTKYANNRLLGSRYQDYLKKSLVLHSKYIYLTVKEAYEELGNDDQIVEINGKKTLVDPYSYVHILSRHYSKGIKEHQHGKTYHFDENIDFKNIPSILNEILNCYKVSIPNIKFDEQKMYVQINTKVYAIWFRKITKNLKGNIKVDFLRVQTFYPVSDTNEQKKIDKLQFQKTNCKYDFWL